MNPDEIAHGIAAAIMASMGGTPPPPEMSKKDRKKFTKRAAKWGEQVMGMVNPHGATIVLFVGGKPIMNNTAMTARVGLMLCDQAATLKASFGSCPCEVCQKVAAYPEHAILAGFREWLGGMINGEHDGQDPERLLSTILRKVEPQ